MLSRQVTPPPIQENRAVASLKDMDVPAATENESLRQVISQNFFSGNDTGLIFLCFAE